LALIEWVNGRIFYQLERFVFDEKMIGPMQDFYRHMCLILSVAY